MPISMRGILLCLVSLLLFACTFPSPPPQIGDRAPSFALEDISGRTVRLEDLRGKVILVHFWSIHCPPCREELPLFAALPSNLGDLPVVIVPISADEGGRGAVIAYLNASGISLPVLLDSDGAIGRRYGITGVPETFIINQQGVVVQKSVGAVDWRDPQVIAYLRQLAVPTSTR